MLTEIEKLDATGREHGIVIYAVHQCRAGWGVQWYEGGNEPDYLPVTGFAQEQWRQCLVVYGYYPTIKEMVTAEARRLSML